MSGHFKMWASSIRMDELAILCLCYAMVAVGSTCCQPYPSCEIKILQPTKVGRPVYDHKRTNCSPSPKYKGCNKALTLICAKWYREKVSVLSTQRRMGPLKVMGLEPRGGTRCGQAEKRERNRGCRKCKIKMQEAG